MIKIIVKIVMIKNRIGKLLFMITTVTVKLA